jgi:hypothetical protein
MVASKSILDPIGQQDIFLVLVWVGDHDPEMLGELEE